ncbi:MAG: M48 family metallopeptidase [Janthinobacterium lividum]
MPFQAADNAGTRTIVLPLATDGRAQTLRYQLRRSSRRSIGFVIDGDGLTITAPRWLGIAEIESAIVGKRRWIVDKLREWQARAAQPAVAPFAWRDGATLPWLGQAITLKVGNKPGATHFDALARTLTLGPPRQHGAASDADPGPWLRKRTLDWLRADARRCFGQRIALYAPRLGVQCKTLALSSATTRWGSCSSRGNIRLNWRLIHFSPTVIDYVVVHELAHLREMNHSPRFWQIVASIFPDYARIRAELKQPAPELLPTL